MLNISLGIFSFAKIKDVRGDLRLRIALNLLIRTFLKLRPSPSLISDFLISESLISESLVRAQFFFN